MPATESILETPVGYKCVYIQIQLRGSGIEESMLTRQNNFRHRSMQ